MAAAGAGQEPNRDDGRRLMSELFADPVSATAVVCASFVAGTWLLSIVTGNYSQVDRIWSITPIVYVAIYAG